MKKISKIFSIAMILMKSLTTFGTFDLKTAYFKDVYKVYSTRTNNGAGIRYRTSCTGSARTNSQKITISQYRFSSESYRC